MELQPEPLESYECDTHRGECGQCPECKRISYCPYCLLCGLCSYPHITVMQNCDHRFWIQASISHYVILDRNSGLLHSPKRVFHSQISQINELNLSPHEVVQIIEEVGYEPCVKVLQHCYDVSGRPYDVRHDIDKWIQFVEVQKRQAGARWPA
jgi:hypothetical protein